MRTFNLTFCCILFFFCSCNAQKKINIYFNKIKDTVSSSSIKEFTKTVQIIVPKQDGFKDISIAVEEVSNEFKPYMPLYFPSNQSFVISSTENLGNLQTYSQTFKFVRDSPNDRLIILKIVARDKKKKIIPIIDPKQATLYLYLKPYRVAIPSQTQNTVRARALFKKTSDTIESNNLINIEHEFVITIPQQINRANTRVEFRTVQNGFNLSPSNYFLPEIRSYRVDTVNTSVDKKVSVKIIRSNNIDREITFKLYSIDSNNVSSEITGSSNTYTLYIKALNPSIKSISTLGEPVKVSFKKTNDTINSSSVKEIDYRFEIEVEAQEKYDSIYVDFLPIKNEFQIGNENIYFATNKPILVLKSLENKTIGVNIKLIRENLNDRVMSFVLKVYDKKGNEVRLSKEGNLVHKVYVKPYTAGLSENWFRKGHQLLFYTGTNFDFLDGIKAKDLYFKVNYFFNIPNGGKPSKKWINISLAKNRYSSVSDTLTNTTFADILNSSKDSLSIVKGKYNVLTTTSFENFAFNLELHNLNSDISNDESRLFSLFGISSNLQNIRKSYITKINVSDTSNISRADFSKYQLIPLPKTRSYLQIDNFLYFGFNHILNSDIIEVKSKLSAGLNVSIIPISTQVLGSNVSTDYTTLRRIFFRLEESITILNPGITLAAEVLYIGNQVPFFNVTLSKVFGPSFISKLLNN